MTSDMLRFTVAPPYLAATLALYGQVTLLLALPRIRRRVVQIKAIEKDDLRAGGMAAGIRRRVVQIKAIEKTI